MTTATAASRKYRHVLIACSATSGSGPSTCYREGRRIGPRQVAHALLIAGTGSDDDELAFARVWGRRAAATPCCCLSIIEATKARALHGLSAENLGAGKARLRVHITTAQLVGTNSLPIHARAKRAVTIPS